MTLDDARTLDAADSLAHCRDRFALPEGVIYLDGNSLGALPRATGAAVADVVERQWGRQLITSWNRHGWIDAPATLGAKLAPLIGAAADELLVCDSTSINLFKLLAAAPTSGASLAPSAAGASIQPCRFQLVMRCSPHCRSTTSAIAALVARGSAPNELPSR